MKTVYDELHDYSIVGVYYDKSQLALKMARRTYSSDVKDFVYTTEYRLVFAGGLDIDAQKVGARSWLTRKSSLYKSAQDLIELVHSSSNPRLPISLIERVEDGFVLHTHVHGAFYIKALRSNLEAWTPGIQTG